MNSNETNGPSLAEMGIEKHRLVVGAEKKPDGSWDFSKAMVMLSPEEGQEAVDKFRQREEIINGRIKHQIEANPNSIVDVEQARSYWGELYDNAGSGQRLEMQLNEIYAQKYEESAKLAAERMMKLEEELNDAENEDDRQSILARIVEERDFIQEMNNEANQRRGY